MNTYEEHLKGKNILLVDDSKLVFRALQRIFRSVGANMFFAPNGASAIPEAENNPIDAIVLDINLGDMNGLDVCRALRANPKTTLIPIIVITAQSDPEHHVAALDAGADDFVSKPPQRKVLMKRLASMIAQSEVEKDRKRLMKQLESYISSATYQQVQSHRGIEDIYCTILFSDMRGFTAASFDYDGSTLFNAINLAMQFQTDIVQEFGGYVDNFTGDGMLAVFDKENSELAACEASIEIITRARVTSVQIWDPLPIGIGIHCGQVMRGDLGTESRRAHTVIGKTVNYSARLCGVAKGREAIASQEVVDRLSKNKNIDFTTPHELHLKGMPAPVLCHPLIIP
jgi:adenylate cyclase